VMRLLVTRRAVMMRHRGCSSLYAACINNSG
jgi:hypothetical protein